MKMKTVITITLIPFIVLGILCGIIYFAFLSGVTKAAKLLKILESK